MSKETPKILEFYPDLDKEGFQTILWDDGVETHIPIAEFRHLLFQPDVKAKLYSMRHCVEPFGEKTIWEEPMEEETRYQKWLNEQLNEQIGFLENKVLELEDTIKRTESRLNVLMSDYQESQVLLTVLKKRREATRENTE